MQLATIQALAGYWATDYDWRACEARLKALLEVGWDAGRVARAWAELMHRLGYTRYVAQGGDVGASVTDAMGRQAPEGPVASTPTCS